MDEAVSWVAKAASLPRSPSNTSSTEHRAPREDVNVEGKRAKPRTRSAGTEALGLAIGEPLKIRLQSTSCHNR
jgi:hypothetical protein